MKRYKTFARAIVQHSPIGVFMCCIALYIIIASTIGIKLSLGHSVTRSAIIGILGGVILLSLIIIAFLFLYLVVLCIRFVIEKLLAIKRYTCLPLSADEVVEYINNNVFEDSEGYFRYICEQMRYCSGIWKYQDWFSLKLSIDDLYKLCMASEEVFGKPIMLDNALYWYLKKYGTVFPISIVVDSYRFVDDTIAARIDERGDLMIITTNSYYARDIMDKFGELSKITVIDLGDGSVTYKTGEAKEA